MTNILKTTENRENGLKYEILPKKTRINKNDHKDILELQNIICEI